MDYLSMDELATFYPVSQERCGRTLHFTDIECLPIAGLALRMKQ